MAAAWPTSGLPTDTVRPRPRAVLGARRRGLLGRKLAALALRGAASRARRARCGRALSGSAATTGPRATGQQLRRPWTACRKPAALVAALAAALAALAALASANDVDPAVDVYFGCGCFWHMQHGLAAEEILALHRDGGAITARAAYAGGTRAGEGGRVCYHNGGGVDDYGALGHTEVVALSVPRGDFGRFADAYWRLCPGGSRQDPQDRGGEYRSAVGLPGGLDSPLAAALRRGAGGARLVPGEGDEGDTLGGGKVYVYDTAKFPAHVAERYHQFHDDMVEKYTGAYNALRRYADRTGCPGDDMTLRGSFVSLWA